MKTVSTRSMTSIFGLLGFIALTPNAAYAHARADAPSADDGEIVVTAQHNAVNKVDVPLTISRLSIY